MCSAATPAITTAATKGNSPQDQLVRLKIAAEQFKQASIIATLDEDKLELFTFYKKLDVLKDQRAILQSFGAICRLNSCIIASKAACRTAELLRPENARLYRLFSEAILSNVELRSTESVEVRRVKSHVYLISSQTNDRDQSWEEYGACRCWTLRQLQFQIVSSGHILLLLKSTDWPMLANMEELAVSHDSYQREPSNSTVYLMPFGQIARSTTRGVETCGSNSRLFNKRVADVKQFSNDPDTVKNTIGWFKRQDVSAELNEESLTVVEVPLLERDNATCEVLWKKVLWPKPLVFVFLQDTHAESHFDGLIDPHDPIDAAQEWCLTGAAAMQQVSTGSRQAFDNVLPEQIVEDTFDNETTFGDQPQYTSQHANGFIGNQTAYPTPPDLPVNQPFPNLSFIDGTTMTPARSPPMAVHETDSRSVPSDSGPTGVGPVPEDHGIPTDHSDDLFDDFTDHQLDQLGFDTEPNWNFFSPQNIDDHELFKRADFNDRKDDDITAEASDLHGHDLTMQPNLEQREAANSDQEMLDSDASHATMQAANVENTEVLSPSLQYQTADLELSTMAKPLLCTIEASSLHPESKLSLQDLKYAIHGKFWFSRDSPLHRYDRTDDDLCDDLSDMSDVSSDDTIAASDDSISRRRKSWMMPTPTIERALASKSNPALEVLMDDIDETDNILDLIADTRADEPFRHHFHKSSHQQGSHSFGPRRMSRLARVLLDTRNVCDPTVPIVSANYNSTDENFVVKLEVTGSDTELVNASLQDLTGISINHQQASQTTRITKLSSPKIRCKWGSEVVSVEPSIMRYWPTLGLEPLSGPKNIELLLLHPTGRQCTGSYADFLRQLKEVYTRSNLGYCETLSLDGSKIDGLVSWDESQDEQVGLLATCESIARTLSTSLRQGSNVVIIMVASTGDPVPRVALCGAFQHLVDSFTRLRSSDTVTITHYITTMSHQPVAEEDLFKITLDIYDRMHRYDGETNSRTTCAVQVEQLAEIEPRFELKAHVASLSTRLGVCCHLAYSVGVDRRWLVAVWTDDSASMTFRMAYQLPADDADFVSARKAVFRQLCDITLHFMADQRQGWWLALTKCGLYEPEEYQEWLQLAKQPDQEKKTIPRMVLLSTELNSRIRIQLANAVSLPAHTASQSIMNMINTPGTTPQAVGTSPEQTMPVTPTTAPTNAWLGATATSTDLAANITGHDIMLVDPLEEAWTVSFGLGLNQSYDHLQVQPALASGLLIKRIRARRGDSTGLAELCVNLLAVLGTEAVAMDAAEREDLLQDMLQRYRALHALTDIKSMASEEGSCLPWHIATAVEGTALLEQVV